MADLPDPADLPALAKAAKAPRKLPRRLTGPMADEPTLRSWAPAYARALVTAKDILSLEDRKAVLSRVARVPIDNISTAFVKKLDRRADLHDLIQGYLDDKARLIREEIVDTHAPLAAKAYELALTELVGTLEETPDRIDLRQVPALVAPALNRVAPEKVAGGSQAAIQVNIALSPHQRNALDAPAIEVEATAVEVVDQSDAA